MPLYPLTKFEIQNYYQNRPKFNSAYSRDNLLKTRDGTYLINPNEYNSIGTHWIVLHVHGDNVTYFDSFGVEHILKVIKENHRQQKHQNKYL